MPFGMQSVDDGESNTFERLNELQSRLRDEAYKEMEIEKALADLKLSDEETLFRKKIADEAEFRKKVSDLGGFVTQEEAERWEQLEQQKFEEETTRIENESAARIAALQAEYDAADESRKAQLALELQDEKDEAARKKKAREEEWKQKKKDIEEEARKRREVGDKEKKKREKEKLKEIAKERGEKDKDSTNKAFGKGKTPAERLQGLKEIFSPMKNKDGEDIKGSGLLHGLDALTVALSDYAKKLETNIDKIAKQQSLNDTRLQGSKNEMFMGSYWRKISQDITGAAGISPLIKQEDIAAKVEAMVEKGIAYNVEQRAFLATVNSKIATTFDAFDSTLLRMVRIQQKDSTAARLGMESMMNTFLNNMYETSEYLSDVAKSVRSSLEEAESLMGDRVALELEYQVQKWLGSLYSVGMSQKAVNSISTTLGQIASGDITGVTSGGTSNLVLMAANQAGISIADILRQGLDASNTNKLMQSLVQYMSDVYVETKENKVVQQQFANVFGISASDLKAAANISNDLSNIYTNNLTYDTAMQQLTNMANSMYSRTSIGEMMENLSSNFQYTMAAGIANNPVLYGIYKTAGLLDDLVGGINIPAINVFGNGVDLNATVADLMRVASLSGSLISGVINMISAGGNGGLTGAGLLNAFGINGNVKAVSRGSGAGLLTSGVTVSSSGAIVSNSSSSDITNKTLGDANESAKNQVAEAKESEDADVPNKTLNENIINIYRLLSDVVSGTSTLSVRVEDYGLVWNK